jgi:DNA-binding transcriptional ArsR family regulator
MGDSTLTAPLELRMALRGLGNETSLAVFLALREKREISFSALKKRVGLEGSALTYQLGRLMESALVEHYYRHELGNERYSFYAVTEFGNRIYDAMLNALSPEKAHEPIRGGEMPRENGALLPQSLVAESEKAKPWKTG